VSDALALPHGPLAGAWGAARVPAPATARQPRDVALTRRRLLLLAGAASATAMLWPSSLAAPGSAAVPAANPFLRSRFVAHLGETFRLSVPGGAAIDVRLDEIRDLGWRPNSSAAGSEDGFVLLFRGPRTPRIGQDVVRVAHPAGTGRRGQDYAAVINRLAPPNR
jgi:hypothetical protein